MKTYDVLIERDGGGWMASVPSVPGAHTQGRTIDQARRRIREALGLWVSDAERANLRVEVKLPATIRRQVERTVALREEAEDRNRDAASALLRAVGRLTDEGLSRRDAGELLGISRQRAQQLAELDRLTESAPQLVGAVDEPIAAKRSEARAGNLAPKHTGHRRAAAAKSAARRRVI